MAGEVVAAEVGPEAVVIVEALVAELAEGVALEGAAIAVAVLLVVLELALGEDLVLLRKDLAIFHAELAHGEFVLSGDMASQLLEIRADKGRLLWTCDA